MNHSEMPVIVIAPFTSEISTDTGIVARPFLLNCCLNLFSVSLLMRALALISKEAGFLNLVSDFLRTGTTESVKSEKYGFIDCHSTN